MSGVGETTVSVQWRCTQMTKHHNGKGSLTVPCPDCYSLIQTNVRVPYLPPLRPPFPIVIEGLPGSPLSERPGNE